MKYPEKHKIFCKFDPKITKTGRHERRPPPDFRDFRVEFAKYFVFFGVSHGNLGHFYEKLARFFVEKMSKIGEHHCSLLSTERLACPVLFDFDDFWVEFVKYFVFFRDFYEKMESRSKKKFVNN
jgi:hypothetical protein